MRLAVSAAIAGSVALLLQQASCETIYWENHTENGDFIVRDGDTVVLRGTNEVEGALQINQGGRVIVDDQCDVHLEVGHIEVSGEFRIGAADAPYAKTAVIELACGTQLLAPDERRKGVLVRANGTLAIHGSKGASSNPWTRLSDTALAGSTCLRLESPSGWQVGDEIVIPSTDFDPHQAEKRTITKMTSECVEINEPLKFMHYGRITEGVDERAEVGLLSRNIVFRGCMESGDTLTSDVGGHMMFLEGFRQVQVHGVELQNFGQGDQLGRYPMHFHLCGRVPSDTFLSRNSIHNSNFRAITIHGTQGVTVDGNVAYNITGHSFMLEDGAETSNIIRNNLIALVKEKLQHVRLGSDAQIALSAFYITNPENTITDNVVAGVEGSAFWIHTRLEVKGQSYLTGKYNGVHPFKVPLGDMRRNIAHSVEVGWKIDSPDLDALDYPQQKYSPPFTYMPDEMAVFSDFTVHHSRQGGWFRMFRVVLDNWIVGDTTEGVQVLTRGDTSAQSMETYVKNSRFVGGTANRGNLIQSKWQFVNYLENRSDSAIDRTDDSRMAIKLYDGPMVISNCTFVLWYSQPCLDVINPALGARLFNTFVMSTSIIAKDLVFEKTDYKLNVRDRESDGGKTTSMFDRTGAISGRVGATILPDWDYYATPNCARTQQWGLACPQRYVNLDVTSVDPSTDPTRYGSMKIYRNNVVSEANAAPSLDFSGQYIPAARGWLYHPIISPGASYTIQFERHTPEILKLTFSNAMAGDVFPIGVVYPPKSQIEHVLNQDGQRLASMSQSEMSSCVGCYWFDSEASTLFVRIQSTADPGAPDLACPSAGCLMVEVHASLPSDSGVSDDVVAQLFPLFRIHPGASDPWMSETFANELESYDSSDNIDWCQIDDPCLHAMDPGNLKMGILAYQQEPCTGVGCFTNSCRYCKLSISAANVSFPICPFDPGYTGAEPVTRCSSFASVGNSEAGVEVIEDIACAEGGVGCIDDVCRYCKSRETTRSSAYLSCSTLLKVAPTPEPSILAPGEVPTSSPAALSVGNDTQGAIVTPHPTTEAPGSTTSYPVTTAPPVRLVSSSPTPTTPQPTSASSLVSSTPTPQVPHKNDALCTSLVPHGDYISGISAISDQLCQFGGLGCFTLCCRYCRASNTPQAEHLLPCSRDALHSAYIGGSAAGGRGPADECWQFVSPKDVALGITALSDDNCRFGGLGCLSPSCRFCKSPQSSDEIPYIPCNHITSSNHLLPSSQPLSVEDACRGLVSSGDVAAGITALTDTQCSVDKGGVGCVSDTCRYCKTRVTRQSSHLVNCTSIASSIASSRRLTHQIVPSKSVKSAAVTSIDVCSHLVSIEENVAGIFGFTDFSCGTDGESQVGCFSDSCRYCRTDEALDVYTPEDSNESIEDFVFCPSYVIASSMGGNPYQEASTLSCAASVTFGDSQAGISAYADVKCTNSAEQGCYARKPCRYCKYRETRLSSSFPVCPFLNSSAQVTARTPCAALPAVLNLSNVSALHEPRCHAASLNLTGCIAFTNCRLCTTAQEAHDSKTAHLPSCVSVNGTASPASIVSLKSGANVEDSTKKSSSTWSLVIECVVGASCVAAVAAFTIQRRQGANNGPRAAQIATPQHLPRSRDGRRVSVAVLSSDADFFVL